MSCIVIGYGTIGKTVATLAEMLMGYYGREYIPMLKLDSETAYAIAISAMNRQIGVAIDGQDVSQAMKDGKYQYFSFIDPAMLSAQSMTAAMKLEPIMGNIASMVHMPTLRNAVVNAVGMGNGDLTVITVKSSFGGTSRGLADKIVEILIDISRGTGRRIQLIEIVTIPGLSTKSSGFDRIYRRNTYAYMKEISALRTGRCQRLVYDDDGDIIDERHDYPSHFMVLTNDTQKNQGTLDMEKQLPTLARMIELLTRDEVQRQFQGVSSDLDQHEAKDMPFCDRAGLFSLYIPNREKLEHIKQDVAIKALDSIMKAKVDHMAMAEKLLGGIGLRAPEVERLKLWNPIKSRILNYLGMNPLDDFMALYTKNAQEYIFQYESLSEAIESIDAKEIGGDIPEWIASRGIVDEQIRLLRKACPPGDMRKVLNSALALAENEQKDLETSVNGSDAGIYKLTEEYEANANSAARSRSLWKLRDTLADVKSNLFSALELRFKAAILRTLVTVLAGFIESINQGEVRVWSQTEQESQDIAQALSDIREEKMAEYLHGDNHRGNAGKIDSMTGKGDLDISHGLEGRIAKGLYLLIDKLYGKPYETIKREMMIYLDRRLKVLDMQGEQLTSRHISQDLVTDALRCAEPTLLMDTTSRRHRRGIFCFSRMTECPEMMQKALSETGIHSDREKYMPLHGVNDELTIMTYERGVPLEGIKSLRDCRDQYDGDDNRYKGHLEPLLELLPDPIGGLDGRQYQIMGVVSGSVTETGDGWVYRNTDGRLNAVSDGFFAEFGNAVEIASCFIVNLKRNGFTNVMKHLSKMTDDNARALLAKLELYEKIYR